MPAQRVLKSWAEAQGQIGLILERINADPGLARAAAANPLLGLEEIGYTIDPAVRVEFEDRLRFPPRVAARIGQLRSEIFALAGRSFDLASPADLDRVLFEELKIQQTPLRAKRLQESERSAQTGPLRPQMGWVEKATDPLEALRNAHPVMAPLLEYRKLEASQPRLATRELYGELRAGKRPSPVTRIRGVLRAQR